MIQYLRKKIPTNLCSTIDKKKLFNLLIGVIMIYITFMIGGILHEIILKQQYTNRFDNTKSLFANP